MRQHWKTILAGCLVLGAALPTLAFPAMKTPSKKPAETSSDEPTAKQLAAQSYNAGVAYIKKAGELEDKARSIQADKKRAKLEAKSRKAYEKAIRANIDAIQHYPETFEAHSNLGYAYRKIGAYEKGLAAYDKALDLEPRYTPAIEYRAEAYLALNRLEEARSAYLVLFRSDRPRALELGAAMSRWLEQRRADSGGLSPEVIEEFADWLSERDEIARQTGALKQPESGW